MFKINAEIWQLKAQSSSVYIFFAVYQVNAFILIYIYQYFFKKNNINNTWKQYKEEQ